MNSRIAVPVGLAAVLTSVLTQISIPTPAYAAEVAADITPGSSSKTTDAFAPNPISINVGDTVTWTNKDSVAHTVTSGTGLDDPNKGKAFDSSPNFDPIMAPQATFSHTFEEPGEFPYFCALHPNMVGTVIVSEGGGNGGPEPAPFSVTATIDGEEHPEPITGTGDVQATEATIQSGQSVTVVFDKAGEVELTLPKSIIEGINDVSAGGQSIDFTPTDNDDTTTIGFIVPEGSTIIVIRGAKVVPEFPVIVSVLAAALAAIIGYNKVYKLRRT